MNNRNDLPVYLFTGFLESGKSTMIIDTLKDKNFNAGERFLVIICEEGEVEYDPTEFEGNVSVAYIEKESDLTTAKLTELEKKYDPERILVEYNGMWMINDFYQNMPERWMVYQEMTFADANTFLSYNANMRQLVVDKLQSCEMVIFNRAKDDVDKEAFHKIVRGINSRTTIAYEMNSGEFVYDEIQDPLPFDLDAPVVEIADKDFAVWYRDMNEDMQKYVGKTLKFKGLCAKEKTIPKGEFVIGRHVMTCCAADITYCGVACRWKGAESIRTQDWMMVTAVFSIGTDKLYEGKGPILTATEVSRTSAPEQPVATFN